MSSRIVAVSAMGSSPTLAVARNARSGWHLDDQQLDRAVAVHLHHQRAVELDVAREQRGRRDHLPEQLLHGGRILVVRRHLPPGRRDIRTSSPRTGAPWNRNLSRRSLHPRNASRCASSRPCRTGRAGNNPRCSGACRRWRPRPASAPPCPGAPRTSELSGISRPSVTSAPAPIRQLRPISRAVKHDRLDADQAAFADRAAMHRRPDGRS